MQSVFLILTIFTMSGVDIESIEFEGNVDCVRAGEAWTQEAEKRNVDSFYVCVVK